MRVIRTLVADPDLEAVLEVLDDHDIDYVILEEQSSRDAGKLVEFPIPTQAVESVLDDLTAVTDRDGYTVVGTAETAFSEHSDEMEERFITGTEEDDSIATEEMRAKALDMTPSPQTYYSMTFLSALVATAGLLIDSPAIVVGSMVIAPLVGSALTASVGTVLAERSMIVEGFKTQLLGLGLAILGATLFSLGLKNAAFLPPAIDITTTHQISQRISPGLLSIIVGISAGGAGAFGLATGVSVTLVGVMIAAALIPAAGAVGIGIAWGIPAITTGATLLLVLNMVGIHVAGASVLWYLGYRPDEWPAEDLRSTLSTQQTVTLVTSFLLLAAVVGGAGSVVVSHVAFERTANEVTDDVLEQERFSDLELASVRTEFGGQPPLPSSERKQVTVVVSRPVDRPYPELSSLLADTISRRTGEPVTVVVEFTEQQTSKTDAGSGNGGMSFVPGSSGPTPAIAGG